MKNIAHLHDVSGIPITGLCRNLGVSRATLYRQSSQTGKPVVRGYTNGLSTSEQTAVMSILNSDRFVDLTPYETYYTLLDEGEYHCSIRTMYRLLANSEQNQPRRAQRSHRNAVKPELVATAPNQVWSWDITKLRTFRPFVYLHLYVILDIFSRYVVGWLMAENESKELARKLIEETIAKQQVDEGQLTLHSDNGPSMTSLTVAQLLETLGVIKSHNRPYTSNDNPFSESQFKTLKYCPEFPKQFEHLNHGVDFGRYFFNWYNTEHYHSGIAWLTPQSVHYNQAQNILAKRQVVLDAAYENKPERFNHRRPKVKPLPEAVYINPPKKIDFDLQLEGNMA